jgi:hypothetical protein
MERIFRLHHGELLIEIPGLSEITFLGCRVRL